LQTNKARQIVSFVHLIHSVDSFKLLKEINKQSEKINKVTNCLLQVHIAREETKFGLDENELNELVNNLQQEPLSSCSVTGLMGMASFTNDANQIRKEFQYLKLLQIKYNELSIANFRLSTLSMGMTSDYTIAIEEGSNMIRIGSLIFGERN
jgi:pyridoxal phosphate enzyme (YggS family)